MSDNELLAIDDLDKFITNYKSVYQAMTAKQDCKTKIFSRNVRVTKDDIADLNNRVVSKLRNYKNAGFSINVNVTFDKKQSLEFSTWDEFENHDFHETSAINSITIIWEFCAVLPQYNIPQKHVLVVKIADALKPQEMLNIVFTGKLENLEDIEKQMYPVVARVDYINFVLGDELIKIVEEWTNSLELQDSEISTFYRFARKHKRKISFLINYVSLVIILACGIKIFNQTWRSFDVQLLSMVSIDNICKISWVLGGIVAVVIVFYKLAEWMANTFYRTMDVQYDNHVFYINNGDSNLHKSIERKKKKNVHFAVGSIVGTIVINVFCSIISSVIMNYIMK